MTLASAVRRHPILTILPAVALLAAGIAFGIAKHPTYSTSATINVGKSDINTQATPGYVQAAEVLASTYSRDVMSQHIAVPAAKALHQSASSVSANLTSVPIPNNPTFTITATGSSSQAAVNLGNAAVNALVKFTNDSQTQQGAPSQLLGRYTSAQSRADQLQHKSNVLQGKFQAGDPGITQAQLTRAQVDAQVAALQAQALGAQYGSLLQNGTAPVLDVLNPPTGATSNRNSNIERYAVVGLVAGLVLGLALAALAGGLEASRARRPI